MARIIVRRPKGSTGSNNGSPVSSNGNAEGTGGTDSPVIQSLTGQPDTDDLESGTGNNGSGAGTNGNSTGFVDPTSATSGSSEGTPKRRGRKPGSKNRASRATATETSKDLTKILLTLHFGLSKIFGEEFLITDEESTELADAVTRVTQLYDIQIMPEKQMAWLNLGLVGCAIYGPRVMTVARKPRKKGRVIEMTAIPGGENAG
jgi:hypothetical protein